MLNYVLKPSYEYQVINNISHWLSNFISWQTYDESFFSLKLNRQIRGGFTVPPEKPKRKCPSKLWPSKFMVLSWCFAVCYHT